jgi:hypothetical protein
MHAHASLHLIRALLQPRDAFRAEAYGGVDAGQLMAAAKEADRRGKEGDERRRDVDDVEAARKAKAAARAEKLAAVRDMLFGDGSDFDDDEEDEEPGAADVFAAKSPTESDEGRFGQYHFEASDDEEVFRD